MNEKKLLSSEGPALRIADLSPDDKPREKAMRLGIRSLSNAELLAIIFGGGLPGKSVIDLSREILGSCGNRLQELASLSLTEMCRRYNGIGPAKAVSLAAAFELGFRCREEQDRSGDGDVIRSSADAYKLIRRHVELLRHEEFWVLFLNRANKVTAAECLSRGGVAATVVDVKLLMKMAVERLASGIIAVHNHPSGTLRPGPEDDRLTRRIKEGAQLLDMRLLDHIIVTSGGYYSYADNAQL